MRVMGIRAEITGPCLSVSQGSFTMDVDGEDFGADVMCPATDLSHLNIGDHLFVVGRVSLTHFDPTARRVFVNAERIDVLEEAVAEVDGDKRSEVQAEEPISGREVQNSSPQMVVAESSSASEPVAASNAEKPKNADEVEGGSSSEDVVDEADVDSPRDEPAS